MFPIYISQSLPQSQATSINIDAKKIKKHWAGRPNENLGPHGPEEIFLGLARAIGLGGPFRGLVRVTMYTQQKYA
jgi:hypothetical protein